MRNLLLNRRLVRNMEWGARELAWELASRSLGRRGHKPWRACDTRELEARPWGEEEEEALRHGCQMTIATLLDCRPLTLQAWGAAAPLRYEICSLPILPSGNLGGSAESREWASARGEDPGGVDIQQVGGELRKAENRQPDFDVSTTNITIGEREGKQTCIALQR